MQSRKKIFPILCMMVFLMNPGAWAKQEDAFERGLKLMGEQRYDEAIEAFSSAIDIIPADYQAYNYRGVAWALKGNYDRAIADYNKALEIRPRYAEAYNNRGFARTRHGNLRDAIADYGRALEINPFFVGAYNNKAWVLATSADQRFRNGGQAVLLAQKAVELRPDVESLDTLAAAYASVGDFDAAVDTQKKVIQKLMLADRSAEVPKYLSHLNRYKSNQPLRIAYASGAAAADTREVKTSLKKQTDPTPSLPAASGKARAAARPEDRKPAAAPKSQAPLTPPLKPLPYTIQVSSFRDRQTSNRVARKLITGGDPAFTSPIEISGKGKWYRIYIGNYSTLAEAKVAAVDLKKREFRYVNIAKKPFTVQVGLPASRIEAQQLQSRLATKGYLAYSLPAVSGKDQTRILIGAYESRAAAAELAQQLRKDGFDPRISLR